MGDCFLWAVFSINTEEALLFGASLSHGKIYVLILTNNKLGYILHKIIWSP
jgi:hypothetical protein